MMLNKNIKSKKLNEAIIARALRESIQEFLQEDGEGGALGGATTMGVVDGSGLAGAGVQYDANALSSKDKKGKKNPRIMTQASYYKDALSRHDVCNFGEKPVGHKG